MGFFSQSWLVRGVTAIYPPKRLSVMIIAIGSQIFSKMDRQTRKSVANATALAQSPCRGPQYEVRNTGSPTLGSQHEVL